MLLTTGREAGEAPLTIYSSRLLTLLDATYYLLLFSTLLTTGRGAGEALLTTYYSLYYLLVLLLTAGRDMEEALRLGLRQHVPLLKVLAVVVSSRYVIGSE